MKICFLDQSTGLKTVRDLETRPRGGMVNSLFKITDYLASTGHEVVVYSDISEGGQTKAGVNWVTSELPVQYDVLVCNRGVGDGYPRIEAKRRILWTHDLPHAGFIPDKRTIKAFDATVFMSKYGERVWRKFYPGIGKSYRIPNGVDKKLFHPRKKNLNEIIYFSHPNRGLRRLPLIVDSIRTRTGKDIVLRAYSSGSMYPKEGEMADHGTEYELDYGKSEAVEVYQPIPSHDLAEEVGRAGLCIMPTGYPEICSNSVLQALTSGTPIVTTGGLGATPEWVKDGWNGALTEFQPADYMVFTAEIIRACCRILTVDHVQKYMIQNAAKTKIYNWDQIGEKWMKMIGRII